MKSSHDNHTRFVLITKGYVKPTKTSTSNGKVIAVRRTDDRPVTRQIKVAYK